LLPVAGKLFEGVAIDDLDVPSVSHLQDPTRHECLKHFPRYKVDLCGGEADASCAINPNQPQTAPTFSEGAES
jgi:hypothetical protein